MHIRHSKYCIVNFAVLSFIEMVSYSKKKKKKERSLFPPHGIQGLYILTSSFFSNPCSHPPLASLAFSTGTLGHHHSPPLDVTHNCAFAYYALSSWNIHSSVSLFKSNLSLKVQIQYYDLPENFSPISPNRMHHLHLTLFHCFFPTFLWISYNLHSSKINNLYFCFLLEEIASSCEMEVAVPSSG